MHDRELYDEVMDDLVWIDRNNPIPDDILLEKDRIIKLFQDRDIGTHHYILLDIKRLIEDSAKIWRLDVKNFTQYSCGVWTAEVYPQDRVIDVWAQVTGSIHRKTSTVTIYKTGEEHLTFQKDRVSSLTELTE